MKSLAAWMLDHAHARPEIASLAPAESFAPKPFWGGRDFETEVGEFFGVIDATATEHGPWRPVL
jgi:hypothetical protein